MGSFRIGFGVVSSIRQTRNSSTHHPLAIVIKNECISNYLIHSSLPHRRRWSARQLGSESCHRNRKTIFIIVVNFFEALHSFTNLWLALRLRRSFRLNQVTILVSQPEDVLQLAIRFTFRAPVARLGPRIVQLLGTFLSDSTWTLQTGTLLSARQKRSFRIRACFSCFLTSFSIRIESEAGLRVVGLGICSRLRICHVRAVSAQQPARLEERVATAQTHRRIERVSNEPRSSRRVGVPR